MTRTRDLQVFDDDDEIKVGFGRGLGLSHEKIAEIIGMSRSGVHAVSQLEKVQRLEVLARAVCAASEARTVEKVKHGAQKRMALLFDDAFTLTEQLLAQTKAKGDQATVSDLMQIHQNITIWATRHMLSEAPKRTQVEGLVQHEVRHTLSLAEAANLLATKREITAAFEKDVIDVTPGS